MAAAFISYQLYPCHGPGPLVLVEGGMVSHEGSCWPSNVVAFLSEISQKAPDCMCTSPDYSTGKLGVQCQRPAPVVVKRDLLKGTINPLLFC